MPDTTRREPQGHRKENSSEVRVVVEVDGSPVGYLELDMERLWPLINHRKRDEVPMEWMDGPRFESTLRAAVIKRLITRLEQHLYRTLGDEIVKAQLDVEALILKAETAVESFGRTKADIDKLVQDSGRTTMDFFAFFWDYLLDERETTDLKKDWKAARTRPQ
jgi:hypothetical protein